MDVTTEGVGVVVLVLGVVVLDVGGVVKSERARGGGDKDDEKVVKVLSLSNGGVEEVDEEDNIVVVGANVKGGGGLGAGCWENIVTPIVPVGAEVDIKPHEFLLPFLFF